jgi:hypothetical protein
MIQSAEGVKTKRSGRLYWRVDRNGPLKQRLRVLKNRGENVILLLSVECHELSHHNMFAQRIRRKTCSALNKGHSLKHGPDIRKLLSCQDSVWNS